jgi:hypothetical protein
LKFITPIIVVFILCPLISYSQADTIQANKSHIGSQVSVIGKADSARQRDAIDVVNQVLDKKRAATIHTSARRLNFSVVPSPGYTLSTGFVFDVTGNVAFYTGAGHKENLSALQTDVAYDTKSQRLLYNRGQVWFPDNQYQLVADVRWAKFPTETYGLGTQTTPRQTNEIDFDYVRVYSTLYKTLIPDFYAGVGYNLDYHYNITSAGNLDKSVSDFEKYGLTTTSRSSGINLGLLYDNRRNSLNPLGGEYANLIYRQNTTFFGSNSNWHSIQIDLRKYLRLSDRSNNVLAFWAMGWFSSSGTPYLDLPQTAGDMYGNSGRGYAEGRFRGKEMLYIESEYRFAVSHNGLFGGVIFANAQSFTNYPSNTFNSIAPGTGAGIRIKVNKHSDTNVCIDYGVGTHGSHGIFVNLGEVF